MSLHYKDSRLLRVSSDDRAVGSKSATDIIFHTNDNDLNGVKKILLKTAIIPNTSYNINAYNNTWLFPNITNPGGLYSIPVGQYTIVTLIAELTSQVAGLTITQSALTSKLTFTMATAFDIIADRSTNPMAGVLGIESNATAVLTYTCTALPNLSGMTIVYIISDTLGSVGVSSYIGTQKNRVIAEVGITVPFGSIQYNEEGVDTQDFVVFHGAKNISSFDIRLTDRLGRVIDLNGVAWELIFRVYNDE